MGERRIGAYVLSGDPVWLAKTLEAYYPILDDLIIPTPVGEIGWKGQALPVQLVRSIVEDIDTRSISRTVSGNWIDRQDPMRAETAQRQAMLQAFVGRVDWVLQIDNDELLPDPRALLTAIERAEREGLNAIEWPMRVLYRRTRRSVFEVVAADGEPCFEYPGAVAVRPTLLLEHARRGSGDFLRVVVENDTRSLQLTHPPVEGEVRWSAIRPDQAIIHNSWARSPREVWRKVRGWGHAAGWRSIRYYGATWLPSSLTWRWLRDFHPFARGLWPRLTRRPMSKDLA